MKINQYRIPYLVSDGEHISDDNAKVFEKTIEEFEDTDKIADKAKAIGIYNRKQIKKLAEYPDGIFHLAIRILQ